MSLNRQQNLQARQLHELHKFVTLKPQSMKYHTMSFIKIVPLALLTRYIWNSRYISTRTSKKYILSQQGTWIRSISVSFLGNESLQQINISLYFFYL